MAISRKRKEELVAEYAAQYEQCTGIILAHYKALTVQRMEGLRRRAREQQGEIFVVTNTLLRQVLENRGVKLPEDALTGPTLAVFCKRDLAPLAKLFNDYTGEVEEGRFAVRGAVLDGHYYDAARAKQLADMPTREQLLAQVLGTINAPASQMVGVVASGIRQVLNVLQAYVDKLEGGVPAEAAA